MFPLFCPFLSQLLSPGDHFSANTGSILGAIQHVSFRNLTISMNCRGNCYDNMVAKSFFSSLKKLRIRRKIYKTRDDARSDILDYIEVFYNRARRHSYLGGMSPEAFELAACTATQVSTILWEVHVAMK